MLGITLKNRRRVSWITEQTHVEDSLNKIKRKEWTWTGHGEIIDGLSE